MSILARSLYAGRLFELANRVCLIQTVSCLSDSMAASGAAAGGEENAGSLRSCDFEVFGTVQGVFFRKHTQQQATKLHLIGWVKNTEAGTVQGHMEGRKNDIDTMKEWLRKTGSPKSKITKVDFSNENSLAQKSGTTFNVKK